MYFVKTEGKTCCIFNLKSLDTWQSEAASLPFKTFSTLCFIGVSAIIKIFLPVQQRRNRHLGLNYDNEIQTLSEQCLDL